MIRNIIAIPTRFKVDMIIDMINALGNEVDEWYIFDNGLPEEERNYLLDIYPVSYFQAYGETIYHMWNRAWKIARTYYQFSNLFIVNDDVKMLPQTFTALSTLLRSTTDLGVICPNYTRSLEDGIDGSGRLEYVTITSGAGGLAGFAFMLKGELEIPYIDENLKWWYGDDDMLKQIIASGYKAAKALDIPIEHIGGRSASQMNDTEIKAKIELDRQYFNSKYGESRQI